MGIKQDGGVSPRRRRNRHPPAAAFPLLQPFDIKTAHAMGGGSAATRGHRTPEPANTCICADAVTAADAG